MLLLLLLMMMTTMMMMIRGLQCSERTALAAGRNAPGCSTNSLQPITLHLHCTAVERRQVRAAVQCSVLLDCSAAGPDSARRLFFCSGCRRATEPSRLYCRRRYCSLTARLPHPGAAHQLNSVQPGDEQAVQLRRVQSAHQSALHSTSLLPATNVSPTT